MKSTCAYVCLQPSQQDIRWLYAETKRRKLLVPQEGQRSAFAERVAIILDGSTGIDEVAVARKLAFEDMFIRTNKPAKVIL